MRYKLLICAFLLLIATPALSQEFSPIVIETGKPNPSVVKSGEPFKVTYRAKFFDTVLIYEEEMSPDNLALEKVEAIDLEVSKVRVNNDSLGFVNVWDFTYTFRIIQPEKQGYKIPPFNFIWAEKKAGVTEVQTKENEKPREILTEEVGVNYVSSIVKPPPLDIRDDIDFTLPLVGGTVLRRWAYAVMGVSFLISLFTIFRFSRRLKLKKTQDLSRKDISTEVPGDDFIVGTELILSPKKARKRFLGELKKLYLYDEESFGLTKERRLRQLSRDLLLAELQGTIRDSMSENEICAKLCELDEKQKKLIGLKYSTMLGVARRLKKYQECIDSGTYFLSVNDEIVELHKMVSGLKFYKQVLSFISHLTKRGN